MPTQKPRPVTEGPRTLTDADLDAIFERVERIKRDEALPLHELSESASIARRNEICAGIIPDPVLEMARRLARRSK